MKIKLGLALALLATLPLSDLNAAPIDREVAILASEQSQNENTQTPSPAASKPVKKTKQEIEAEEKRLREERRNSEKKLKEERDAARKQIEEGKKETIKVTENRRTNTTTNTRRTSTTTRIDESQSVSTPVSTPSVAPAANSNVNTNSNTTTKPTTNENTPPKPTTNATTPQNPTTNPNTPTNPNTNTPPTVGMPNPMTPYASFEELSKALGFTPLYLPKQSGYTVNEIYSIDNKLAELHYGRRWEPEVSLIVRTYKRMPNEELKDISGVYGVKWRIDTTSNTTTYIAKVNDATNVAAWAVGDYTFSAYVENLSFAAFHTLIVEELVDLSNHYFV